MTDENEKIFDEDEKEYQNLDTEEDSKEIPKDLRTITTQPYDYSVDYVVSLIKKGKIFLYPDFQRNASVWDNKISSLLIESILLNVPIPPMYVVEEENGTWNVIDGLQRLNTFNRFYNNEFKLRNLDALTELNRKSYDELPDKAQNILNDGNLRIVVIKKESHSEMKYDIFMRLNRGAVKLNNQELRNCLYRGNLNNLIKDLCDNKIFLKIMRIEKRHIRMLDAELILRYFAFSHNFNNEELEINNYKSIIKTFLNTYMESNKDISITKGEELKEKFENTINKVYEVFGDIAFRKDESNWINKALFDVIMLSFEKFTLEQLVNKKIEIKNLLKDIIKNDTNFINSISTGTSEKTRLNYRLSKWTSSLRDIINEK